MKQTESSTKTPSNCPERIPSHLKGIVARKRQPVDFVAEEIEAKIKSSSRAVHALEMHGVPRMHQMDHQYLSSHFQAVNTIVSDLETEIRKMANSVQSLIENLTEILHSMSGRSADCLEIYRSVVYKTCDAVDINIKSMFQLMANCEELRKSMKPIYKLHGHVKEIKYLLSRFERALDIK